ncbi:hypothetical protein [Nocardia sp. NPDC051570]|uniref:hypothetical protein n=1 Tax=Nocardia sp. NPDC051570 TaxID=3364324 RepID=UPI00378888C4
MPLQQQPIPTADTDPPIEFGPHLQAVLDDLDEIVRTLTIAVAEASGKPPGPVRFPHNT